MNGEEVLAKGPIESLFNICLSFNDVLDLELLKKELPAVYWNLHPKLKALETNIYRQRLIYNTQTFSDIIVSVSADELTVEYLQLIPLAPNSEYPPPENFFIKYLECLVEQINNIIAFSRSSGLKKISSTLLNRALASVFFYCGFQVNQDEPQSIDSVIPLYPMTLALT